MRSWAGLCPAPGVGLLKVGDGCAACWNGRRHAWDGLRPPRDGRGGDISRAIAAAARGQCTTHHRSGASRGCPDTRPLFTPCDELAQTPWRPTLKREKQRVSAGSGSGNVRRHARQANASAAVDGKGKTAPSVHVQTIALSMENASSSSANAMQGSLVSIVRLWNARQTALPTAPATTAHATVLQAGVG